MKLTDSQKEAFRSFTSGANIFLTGKGGSGKSFLTRYIDDWCKEHKLSVIKCAPTGVAALNIGGSTIHRTFGIKVDENGILKPNDRCHDKKKLGTLGRADIIIIDEISMCRADVFAYVANTLIHVFRQHRDDGKRHQLLVVGDFFQLPPVLTKDQQEAYNALWGNTLFAFQTKEWQQIELQTMMLTESMRQSDKAFVSALDNIREGKPDFGVFDTVSREFDPTLLTICGTNKQAAAINDSNLRTLTKNGAKEHVLQSKDTGHPLPGDYPTDKELRLCIGARVMLLTNDPDKRWVNGSFGVIKGFAADETQLTVKIDGADAPVDIERNTWTISEYTVEPGAKGEEPKLVQVERATIEQFPVKLAWAISIHKSQGATYDKANINIENIFSAGQLYVALSRCRSLKGMNIIGRLSDEKVMTDGAVLKFMQHFGKAEWSGPGLNFEVFDDPEPGEDRYQEGWDDGYDYRTKEVQEYYQDLVDKDLSVKRLSARATREREKALLPEEERNPKGAGRKKLPVHELAESKAIRVPGVVADSLKEIGEIAKKTTDLDSLLQDLKKVIEAHKIFG